MIYLKKYVCVLSDFFLLPEFKERCAMIVTGSQAADASPGLTH